jgi:ABC-type branched-subunit amino acid transport system substrate-binding protein
LAIGSPIDAVMSYTSAFKKARDSEKESIIVRFNEAAGQLGSADIIFLLGRMEDEFPTGYLMYQLGNNYAKEAKYADAVRMLSAFIEKFPRHAKIGEAKELIQAIGQKSVYSRYTIGCLLPLSGRYRTYGNRALKGVELALNRFSPQDPNSSIKIIIKDTGSDPDKAVAAVQDLFKENVAAIIGPLVTAEAAALEAQNSGIPIITLTQKEDITQIGDYVFRNFFTPEMQVKTIVSFAVEKLGLDSFAILYPDENYGTTFMNLFWDEVLAQGGRIVGVESYKSSQTDFADPIKKLVGLYYEVPEDLKAAIMTADAEGDYTASKDLLGIDLQFTSKVTYGEQPEEADQQEGQEAETDLQEDQATEDEEQEEKEEEPEPIIDFDAVFIPDEPKKSGLIIPQLAFYDIRETYLLGTNLWHSGTLIEMARQYAQGAIMTDGFFAQSTAEPVKSFVRIFEKTFAEKPEFIEAVAYDTAMMLFELVSRPEILFRSVLKAELIKLKDYEGVTGPTSFDENGDVRKKLKLLQIKGKGFVELEQH